MTDIKSEIRVPLTTPLKYSANGGFEEANELILKAPSNKQGHEANELRQGFFHALKGSADASGNVETTVDANDHEATGNVETTVDANDHEATGDEIVSALVTSDIDYYKYINTFRKLLLNGVCFVAEGVKLTSPLFDSLSLDDTDTLLGEYLANFLLASQLKKLKGK